MAPSPSNTTSSPPSSSSSSNSSLLQSFIHDNAQISAHKASPPSSFLPSSSATSFFFFPFSLPVFASLLFFSLFFFLLIRYLLSFYSTEEEQRSKSNVKNFQLAPSPSSSSSSSPSPVSSSASSSSSSSSLDQLVLQMKQVFSFISPSSSSPSAFSSSSSPSSSSSSNAQDQKFPLKRRGTRRLQALEEQPLLSPSSSDVSASSSSSSAIDETASPSSSSSSSVQQSSLLSDDELYPHLPELKGAINPPLLTPSSLRLLLPHLPYLLTLKNLHLVFSSSSDGYSLSSLYTKLRHYHQKKEDIFVAEEGAEEALDVEREDQQSFLLLIKDADDHIFGCFSPHRFSIHKLFYSNAQCFVFSLQPKFAVYPAAVIRFEEEKKRNPSSTSSSSANDNFILARTDLLAIGSGTHFALSLDKDLRYGSSGPSTTFDSPCLSKRNNYLILEVEVWGFD